MLDLTYSNLIELIKPYKIASRRESTAFLHWFLTNIYRLSKIEVDDIVCDGHGDKGIDGIYINDYEGCIDVFQSKIVQRSDKTLGDTVLKEFLGTLRQLETESSVESLISTTSNNQLKHLLEDNKEKILSTDYSIRGLFVTNTSQDSNAENLLKTISSSSTNNTFLPFPSSSAISIISSFCSFSSSP